MSKVGWCGATGGPEGPGDPPDAEDDGHGPTAAAHSRLLCALYEWKEAGGSIDEVVDAVREMVDARLADNGNG